MNKNRRMYLSTKISEFKDHWLLKGLKNNMTLNRTHCKYQFFYLIILINFFNFTQEKMCSKRIVFK